MYVMAHIQSVPTCPLTQHTLSFYGGADELFLSIQPVVSLHHSCHRGGEVIFENDLACAVATSINLEQNRNVITN